MVRLGKIRSGQDWLGWVGLGQDKFGMLGQDKLGKFIKGDCIYDQVRLSQLRLGQDKLDM